MIPINSICYLIATPVYAVIAIKLYLSYRKYGDPILKNFFKSGLFLWALMFILSLPGIVFNDLMLISLVFAVYPFFALMALAYLAYVPLEILGWYRQKKIYSVFMLAFASMILIMDFLNWKPAIIYLTRYPYVFWGDTRGNFVNILIGLVLVTTLLLTAAFFIVNGLKHRDKYIRLRAFFIAGTLFGIMMGSLINFLFRNILGEAIASLISAIVFIISGILLFLSVLYKQKPFGQT